MPQASERLLATPMIRPRLPRIRPGLSGINLSAYRPAASYGIGTLGQQANGLFDALALLIPFVLGNMIRIEGFS
jgi:hypothetical protein